MLHLLEIGERAAPSKRDVAAFRLLEVIPGVERGRLGWAFLPHNLPK